MNSLHHNPRFAGPQDISEAAPGRWVTREFDEFLSDSQIPEKPGCYVLILNDGYVYVGSSENLAARLRSHGIARGRYSAAIKTPWGTCAKLTIKYSTSKRVGDWLMREYRLIRRLRPILNVRHVITRKLTYEYEKRYPIIKLKHDQVIMPTVWEFVNGVTYRTINQVRKAKRAVAR